MGLFLVLFLAAPFLMLPFCFFLIYQKKTVILYLPAVFLSCWSALIPPVADQNRYYIFIQQMRDSSLMDYFSDYEFNSVTLLCFVFAKMNLNLEILRVLIVFLSYCIVIHIFRKIVVKDISQRDYLLIYCILMLSVPYSALIFGFRYGLAVVFYAAGMYYLLIDSKHKTGIVFLACCMLTHLSFYFIVPFSCMFHFLKKYIPSRIIYLFALLFLLSINFSYEFGVSLFQNYWSLYIRYVGYFEEGAYWNSGYYEAMNWRGYLFGYWIPLIPAFFLLFIFLKTRKTIEYDYVYFAPMVIGFTLWFFPQMRGRMFGIIPTIGSIFLVFYYIKGIIKRKYLVIFCVIQVLCQGIKEYGGRTLHDWDREVSALIYPLPLILNNSYDSLYVNHKISEDGDSLVR